MREVHKRKRPAKDILPRTGRFRALMLGLGCWWHRGIDWLCHGDDVVLIA